MWNIKLGRSTQRRPRGGLSLVRVYSSCSHPSLFLPPALKCWVFSNSVPIMECLVWFGFVNHFIASCQMPVSTYLELQGLNVSSLKIGGLQSGLSDQLGRQKYQALVLQNGECNVGQL